MENLETFLSSYGYWVFFAVGFAEFVGVPIVSVPVLIGGGVLVASGTLGFWGVVVSVAVGGWIADLGWYSIGRRGGAWLIEVACGLPAMESALPPGNAPPHGSDAARLSRPAPLKREAADRAGESRRPFGRPPPDASCVRVFASGGGRQDRADSAVTEPAVNQAEDAAIHQVTDQAGEHGRSSGDVPVNAEAHAH